jgi:(2R)-3-sulfolactate dehydrogenase (NADP+)
MRLSIEEATALARDALAACGASDEVARVMAEVLVDAESRGLAGVGLAHLVTYCEGLRDGRIDGSADPVVERPTPLVFRADAKGGVGHTAFERAVDAMADAATEYGLALFSQKGSFTNAALDWFVRRLAGRGLVALAATNGGPAFLAPSGGTKPAFCTNPMAFAVPGTSGPAVLIDQSSSATAYVNIVLAAERGEAIPEGWALTADGAPTTDPVAAMSGVLLAFGGGRGANLALMVELLAAGLAGANWSMDAPSFVAGGETPGIGLFVLAIDPQKTFGDGFDASMDAYTARLTQRFEAYIPGPGRDAKRAAAESDGMTVDPAVVETLEAFAGR